MQNRYVIPSVDRALQVLSTLSEQRGGSSLADLGRRTGIPKSTLYRIIVTLQRHRCVLWNEDERTYQLGSRLSELGNSFLAQDDIFPMAVRYMKRLAAESEETVFLGKLEDGEVVYLRRMESPTSVMVVKKLVQRVPAHCTATGAAILAYLPEQDVEQILDEHGMPSYNDATITDRSTFLRRLAEVRRRGFSIVDGEYNAELLCVSAPIIDYANRPRAALTVAVLAGRGVSDERLQSISEMVLRAARAFSRELGHAENQPQPMY